MPASKHHMSITNLLTLIFFIGISQLAGIVGSVFTRNAIPTWYADITLPTFAPPNWIFAPVWTTLFLLMGIAAFLVYKKRHTTPGTTLALLFFGVQLSLNTLWSIIFFGFQNPGGAFIEIIFLWLALLGTIITFSRVSRTAGLLLLPYIAWVSFAGYLNYTIWMLN